MVEHGIHLTKFWLDVSRDEQKRRFKQRRVDPVRRWKLSPVDIASLDRWDDYTAAIEEMFRKTESPVAPWTIIRSDDKRRARLNAIRVFLHSIEYAEKDEEQIGPGGWPDRKVGARILAWLSYGACHLTAQLTRNGCRKVGYTKVR